MNTLENEVNLARDKNLELEAVNLELKDLFILKDFEINGVKPSENTEETNVTTAIKPESLKGNQKIYTIQLGVYMQKQPYKSSANIDNVWYSINDLGSYIYYSGEFNSPQAAAAHMQKVIKKGYPDAFVATISR